MCCYIKKALPFKVKCVIYLSNNLYIHIKHLACNATWFGDGCKSQCGYCLGENNCHHVNGSCLLGCQEGFTGDLCFDRECCIYVLWLNVKKGILPLSDILLALKKSGNF